MALKLGLRPGERLVINGAVFENGGGRNVALLLQSKVSVLLEKDMMQPQDADTPAKRLYVLIILLYLNEDARDRLYSGFLAQLAEVTSSVHTPSAVEECVGIGNDVRSDAYYRALMRCRKLIAHEAARQAPATLATLTR